MTIRERVRAARQAGRAILSRPAGVRTRTLGAVAQALIAESERIFKANADDLARAESEGLAVPLLKRLKFNQTKLERVVGGIRVLENAPDPVGRVLEKRELDENLVLSRVAGPIGVIGMIFESRPDALVQMATLCLRSGNAVILKGGSEARETNRVLAEVIAEASTGVAPGWIQLAETRADVAEILTLDEDINLLIPRGSNEFVARIMRESDIPVLGHADGICHVYLDASADVNKAVPVVVDSKLQYPAACNAVETLLVHKDAAETVLPAVAGVLTEKGCRLLGCERTRALIEAAPADEADWSAEYLDAELSVKVVDSLEEAVRHIHTYGSGHTDAIVTEDSAAAEAFLASVDAADVFHNCSTRFADGFVFGLGAEVGISTSRIHARGPVGVDGLMSYRWQLRGDGQVRADYDDGDAVFTHRELKPE